MSALRRRLTLLVSTDRNDARLGAGFFFVSAFVVLVLCVRLTVTLDLTGEKLFFGLLLSLCVSLLMIAIGLLLTIKAKAHE